MRTPADITHSRLAELVASIDPDAPVASVEQLVGRAEDGGWLGRLTELLAAELATVAKSKLPEFPFTPGVAGPTCPACESGRIQYVDFTERWWNVSHTDRTNLVFCGSFETCDGGHDAHVTCVDCGETWDVPANVTWE